MKNIFLKFVIILGSASIFVAVFLAFRPGPVQNSPRNNFSASIAEIVSPPKEGRILIQAAEGGGVWVNNFYKTAKAYWPEMNAILLRKTSGYEVRYYRDGGSFEVALNTHSSVKDKANGEDSLFDLLGIGKPDLCRLNVAVTSPYDIGDTISEPLSFCGSVLK